jgi:hypothetical protein
MGRSTQSETRYEQRLATLVAKLPTVFGTQATLSFLGQTWTHAQVVALVQAAYAPYANVRKVRSAVNVQLGQAIQARRLAGKQTKPQVDALCGALQSFYGRGSLSLAQLGLPTGKRKKPKPATIVAAANQARATRLERHTLGPVQRRGIKAPGQE